MYEALQSYFTWWQFILIALILCGLYYLINRFKKYLFKYTRLHSLYFPNLLIIVLLVLSFVLVNPMINGLIVIVALVLFYPIITSFLKGIMAFSNMKLKNGDLIRINGKEGRISGVAISGIKLHTGSNNIFIPFGQLADNIIERYQRDQKQFLSFTCEAMDENTKLTSSAIERLVFNFPFLEHKSNIEVVQIDDKFKVNLSLANNRFRSSLLEQFKEAGYKVELSKK